MARIFQRRGEIYFKQLVVYFIHIDALWSLYAVPQNPQTGTDSISTRRGLSVWANASILPKHPGPSVYLP